jgi:hypothetical protein
VFVIDAQTIKVYLEKISCSFLSCPYLCPLIFLKSPFLLNSALLVFHYLQYLHMVSIFAEKNIAKAMDPVGRDRLFIY